LTVHCAQEPWLLWGSWQNGTYQWFPICIMHQIWSTVMSFYSPGWLLPWRGKDLRDVVQIHLSITQQLQAILKQEWHRCIEKWKNCCNHCIHLEDFIFEDITYVSWSCFSLCARDSVLVIFNQLL
jgi:hypothetical protein